MAAGWKRSAIGLLFTTGMIVSFASKGWAEDDIDHLTLSPEQLFDAKVVSVSKTSEKVMDAPAAITVLTGDNILRAGATSIPEALRLVPGVQVAQVNSHSWAVSVRGFNGALANKLLVLIDGREIYDPLFSGVYWDIQDLVLEDIDRIEVVRGPGATLWGANAVNGVINIITKKAADTQGNLTSFTAGDQYPGIIAQRYGGKFGDSGYYRIYGKYTNRSDFETPAGDNANDGQDMVRSGFRADWNSTEKNDFTLQGDVYNSNDGDIRALPKFNSPFFQLDRERIEAHGANLLGRWSRTLADDSSVSVQSFVDYTMRNQDILGDERVTFSADTQYELPTFGAHRAIVGLGFRYSYDSLTQSPYASFIDDGENTYLYSAFIQDKITLEPKTWFLTLGSKFEHNNFTGFELQPNARLQWHPDERQMVWASVSRAVRTPSRLEHDLTLLQSVLPLAGLPAKLFQVPNTDFKSERLTAYEMGYRNQVTPAFSLDITGFYNDYSHLATLSFLTPNIFVVPFLFPYTTTNNVHGNTDGIELAANWQVTELWKLSASYTLLQMFLVGPSSNEAINSTAAAKQPPSQQFNIASRWDVTKDIDFDSTLYYVAALPAYQLHEYWRLDMRLGWKVLDGLQFNLVGQNLFDAEHREFDSSSSNIGRAIYGNFTWRY